MSDSEQAESVILVPVTLSTHDWSIVGSALTVLAEMVDLSERGIDLRRLDGEIYDQIRAALDPADSHSTDSPGDV